jgi:hypothetical protein
VQISKQDLREYVAASLLPTYEEFISYYISNEIEHGRDRRNAERCAESMLHFGDRIFHLNGGAASSGFPNPTELRRSLFKSCRQYAIVSDVALVSKHVAATRGEGIVRRADALVEHIAIDRYEDHEGPYFRFRKLLELSMEGGNACDFGRVLYNAAIFLFGKAVELGAVPSAPMIASPLPFFVTRDSPDRERSFSIFSEVGDRIHRVHKIFFYRPALGILTPGGKGDLLKASPSVSFTEHVGPSRFGEGKR